MPELPEVETLRRSLERDVVGCVVDGVRLHRSEVASTPRGTLPSRRDLLVGSRVAGVLRHGKQAALVGSHGGVVRVHLGMTGQIRVLKAGAKRDLPHAHVVWTLQDGRVMVFRDPRRFGSIRTWASVEDLRQGEWDSLGPDALTLNARTLQEALSHKRQAIKAALLNQRTIAGVGNIYADEILFKAAIAPTRASSALSGMELRRLAGAIRGVLRSAIEAGGSTLRDYVDSQGRAGWFQTTHQVYGRGGLPCVRCGTLLRRIRVCERSTVYCPRCQR